MNSLSPGIRVIPGHRRILVVAPHGPYFQGRYRNDLLTGVMAEAIQGELGCSAVINDRFFKPKGPLRKNRHKFILDLYRIDHAGKVPGYLEAIRSVVDADGKTLLLWLHGLSDAFAAAQGRFHIDKGAFGGAPRDLEALIAFGQGGDPKTGDPRSSHTARPETAEAFREALCCQGITTLLTHPEARNYRGRDAKRLNQWFVQMGYGFAQVESLDLEVRISGYRDSVAHAERGGRLIAEALSQTASLAGA